MILLADSSSLDQITDIDRLVPEDIFGMVLPI